MPVYVVVHVTYDHYRFQENMWGTPYPEEARAFAEKWVADRGQHITILEDDKVSQQMDDLEHILIEQFNP